MEKYEHSAEQFWTPEMQYYEMEIEVGRFSGNAYDHLRWMTNPNNVPRPCHHARKCSCQNYAKRPRPWGYVPPK